MTFPEKDPAKPQEQQGLYGKFYVERVDGSDKPGGPRAGAKYFVLDLTNDPYALETIAYYAKACKDVYPILAKDLMDMARNEYQKMDDNGKI